MLRVLVISTVLAGLGFALLAAGCAWAVHGALAGDGVWAWLAGALGGLVAALSSVWLFLPLAVMIAGLFMETVCARVEAQFYPGLPPAQSASIAAQIGDGLLLGLRMAWLSVLALILALIFPGVGFLLGLMLNAWALARSFYVAVAMRRMPRRAAIAGYDAVRPQALVQGLLLALLATVPLLNLLIPILGPAVMLHVLHMARPGAAAGGGPPPGASDRA